MEKHQQVLQGRKDLQLGHFTTWAWLYIDLKYRKDFHWLMIDCVIRGCCCIYGLSRRILGPNHWDCWRAWLESEDLSTYVHIYKVFPHHSSLSRAWAVYLSFLADCMNSRVLFDLQAFGFTEQSILCRVMLVSLAKSLRYVILVLLAFVLLLSAWVVGHGSEMSPFECRGFKSNKYLSNF